MSIGVVVRLARRSIASRVGRLVATVIGAVLATTFAVASFGVSAQFDRLLGEGVGQDPATAGLPPGSIVVVAPSGSVTQPIALSDAVVDLAASVPGVLAATGTFDQPIGIEVPAHSQDVRPPVLRGLVFTSAWSTERWALLDGVAPAAHRSGSTIEVALDAGAMLVTGRSVGDTVRLQTPVGGVDARIVGLVGPSGSSAAMPTRSPGIDDVRIVVDPQVLAGILAAHGRVDRITVVPAGGVSLATLSGRLREVLPAGLELVRSDDRDALRAQSVATISDDIGTATWALAGVSALVAALLIANTFSILVSQRTAEIALARCIGVTSRQTMASVLVESTLVGIVAALGGLALGAPLAMIGAASLQPGSRPGLLITTPMVATAVAVGLGVTVLAASLPAWRAGRVAPLEALRAVVARRRHLGASHLFTTPLLRAVRRVGRRSRTVRMATDSALRESRRSGATASTMAVGLGLVAMVLTASSSVHASIDDRFAAASRADLFIERRGVVRVDADSLEAQLGLRRRPIAYAEVTSVDATLSASGHAPLPVNATTFARMGSVFDLDLDAGTLAARTDDVLLSTVGASALAVDVGDAVSIRTTSGRARELRVAGIYRRAGVVGDALIDRSTARSLDAEGTFETAGLAFGPGAPLSRIQGRLQRNLSGFQRIAVQTPAEFAALNAGIADVVTRLLLVLVSGTVLLGGLGAANTVSLSVLERRRELALLRAIGGGRAMVRRLVVTESVIICWIASLLGTTVGVALGVLGIVRAPVALAGHPVIPWTGLIVAMAGAVLLGAVCGAVPARVASRRDVLRDLAEP